MADQTSNGVMDWLKGLMGGDTSSADILKGIGGVVGGYMTNAQQQAKLQQDQDQYNRNLQEKQAEFGRLTGNAEATAAANAEQALNRSPMADKAQYQLMARMGIAPTAFKPRDYTQGLSNIASKPTGGYGDVMDSMSNAAKSYTTGAGGVDTSALALLKNRMLANAAAPSVKSPTTNNAGSTVGGSDIAAAIAAAAAAGGGASLADKLAKFASGGASGADVNLSELWAKLFPPKTATMPNLPAIPGIGAPVTMTPPTTVTDKPLMGNYGKTPASMKPDLPDDGTDWAGHWAPTDQSDNPQPDDAGIADDGTNMAGHWAPTDQSNNDQTYDTGTQPGDNNYDPRKDPNSYEYDGTESDWG
jgi:hypothetical protein